MSVKASISITDQQDAFARKLVEEGQYESLSDVVQRGLELVREESEWAGEDFEALKKLLTDRMEGKFIPVEESDKRIRAMIAKKKAELGL